jgi:hypothetical protein
MRTLYRPVGLDEAVKIVRVDGSGFPARRPEQPIFSSKLTRDYAEQVAQRWDAPNAMSGYAGFVTAFQVDTEYVAQFKAHAVGSSIHREVWVPAEQLEAFNQHLIGPIDLVSAYYGEQYTGPTPLATNLKGRSAYEQLPLLERIRDYSGMDFLSELQWQRLVVQLNFAYWVRSDFTLEDLSPARKVAILQDVQTSWQRYYPATKLIGSDELQELAGELTQ